VTRAEDRVEALKIAEAMSIKVKEPAQAEQRGDATMGGSIEGQKIFD